MAWLIYKWDPNTNNWIYDYSLPNPGNRTIPVRTQSTMRVVRLVDGSQAYVMPQIAAINQPIRFEITQASARPGHETKIKEYIQNHTKIKLVTHTLEEFVGWFRSINKIYELSGRTQRYHLEIEFQRE